MISRSRTLKYMYKIFIVFIRFMKDFDRLQICQSHNCSIALTRLAHDAAIFHSSNTGKTGFGYQNTCARLLACANLAMCSNCCAVCDAEFAKNL
jgi:hypothetical protein